MHWVCAVASCRKFRLLSPFLLFVLVPYFRFHCHVIITLMFGDVYFNQSIKYISGIIHRYSPEDFPTVLVGLLFADVGGRGSFQVFRHGLPSWKVESGKGRSWLWDFFILHPFVLLQILFSGCFKSFIKNWLKSMTMSYYLIIRKKLLHFHFLYILAKFIVGLQ